MKSLLASTAFLLGAALSSASLAQTAAGGAVAGAGASFPAPLYAAWAADYQAAKGMSVTYQPVGSGAGVRQIEASAVDFGGTDKPLTQADLDKNGLIQFPTVLGGVVPVINVPGLESGKLRLDGPALADIFSGKITKWNDPRLQALNPGLSLPDWPVTVAYRSDKSGTSYLFTTYLSSVSPAWKAGPGAGDTVAWPAGLGGKGNAGVAEIMAQSMGTIGYVEYAYAKQNKLDLVVLKTHDGAFIEPDPATFSAAAEKADWAHAPGLGLLILDQPGARSWPITAATFVLVRKDASAGRRQQVLRFFDWDFAGGDARAAKENYVPLPAPVKALVRKSWGADAPVGD